MLQVSLKADSDLTEVSSGASSLSILSYVFETIYRREKNRDHNF